MNPGESARSRRMDLRRSAPETPADAPAPPAEEAPATPAPPPETREERSPRRRRRFPMWVLWLLAIAAVVTGVLLWSRRPAVVALVQPQVRTLVETIAAAGEVSGQRETVVGSQAQGVVTELSVREGSAVRRGQELGRIRNEVAEAQVRQAREALETARAQLAEAGAGARQSELQAGQSRVTQAQATVAERAAQVAQARSRLQQAQARAEMARKDYERYKWLLNERAIARQRVEQALTEYRVAQADVKAARDAIETAQASERAARAVLAGARADYQTLRAGPRGEQVEVARRRVREAEAALRVAQEQSASSVIRAPFDGTVTQILAEVGTAVGAGGLLRLVETTRPEIDVDVDEQNLAELKAGQRAIVTSPTFRNARFEAPVTRISPSVDPLRGTVTVTLVPEAPPAWLRPGQTVNVEIVTDESARRVTIPTSAVKREGGRSVVLQVRDGRAVAQPVVVGELAGNVVPVLEGLQPEDRIILNAQPIQTGERVRVP